MLNQVPKNVRTLAILLLIPAILDLVAWIDQFFLHWFSPPLTAFYSQQVIIGATIFLVFELLQLFLIYNLVKLKSWVWMTILILTGLEILAYLFVLYQNRTRGGLEILHSVINLVVMYYLLKPNVRQVFRRTPQDTI
jgi:hypothetical protein